VRSISFNGPAWRCLKTHDAITAAVLHDPIHACSAGCEAISVCRHNNRRADARASGDHGSDRIDLCMHVMTSKFVFDVAANKNATVDRQNGAADPSLANYVGVISRSPRGFTEFSQLFA
jgi:hypothetical protein